MKQSKRVPHEFDRRELPDFDTLDGPLGNSSRVRYEAHHHLLQPKVFWVIVGSALALGAATLFIL